MQYTAETADVGKRVDGFLAGILTSASRAQIRGAIDAGKITVNGQRVKSSYKVREGDVLAFPELQRKSNEQTPQAVDLEILFEDEYIAAVNKPPGMVTHPAKGHWDGTLTAAMLHRFSQLSNLGGESRPGIVHRLDRDTSGVLVIAKNNEVHAELTRQFAARETEKEYFAIVAGVPDRDRDIITEPIASHPRFRERMCIAKDPEGAKSAETFFEVRERFEGFAAVAVFPKTGRTHQIRVHLSHIGYPVLCDRLYGGRARITLGEMQRSEDETATLTRTALHARRLKITHPKSGNPIEFIAEIPEDIRCTIEHLRKLRPPKS